MFPVRVAAKKVILLLIDLWTYHVKVCRQVRVYDWLLLQYLPKKHTALLVQKYGGEKIYKNSFAAFLRLKKNSDGH